MLVMIDGPMINRFIEDADFLGKCADDHFHELDGDGDGFISRIDFRRRSNHAPAVMDDEREGNDSCDLFFSRFDVDRDGSIDREEFRLMVMEMLIAVARGIGSTPVNVGVEEDSLLVRVYEHDLARIEKELEEIADRKRRNGIGGKELWKKMRSKKMLKIRACSCSCFGQT